MELAEINELTEQIIGLAIKVHRTLGPGLLESVYQMALAHELAKAKIKFEKDENFLFNCYKGFEKNHPDTEKINFTQFYDHLKKKLKLN